MFYWGRSACHQMPGRRERLIMVQVCPDKTTGMSWIKKVWRAGPSLMSQILFLSILSGFYDFGWHWFTRDVCSTPMMLAWGAMIPAQLLTFFSSLDICFLHPDGQLSLGEFPGLGTFAWSSLSKHEKPGAWGVVTKVCPSSCWLWAHLPYCVINARFYLYLDL